LRLYLAPLFAAAVFLIDACSYQMKLMQKNLEQVHAAALLPSPHIFFTLPQLKSAARKSGVTVEKV
jgi:hypothetical protein